MSDPRHASGGGSIVRPFLNRPASPRPEPAKAAPPPEQQPVVRAYMITNGRTESTGVKLEFEAMVTLTDSGRAALPRLMFEQAKIAGLCVSSAQSVAELAAKIRIPLGTAQVLAGDMVGAGLLSAHVAQANQANDISLIQRLIHGVRSL